MPAETTKRISPLSRRSLSLGALAAIGVASLPRIQAAKADTASPETLALLASTAGKGLGSIDYYVADAVGFLKDENLSVTVDYAANASQAAQLVASGNSDLGRFSFDPALIGYSKGLQLKGFYQFYRKLYFYLGIPVDSSIKTLSDLQGKTVGVINMGSAAVGILKSMLTESHVPVQSVRFVPVGSAGSAYAARRSGSIDAYMMSNEIFAALLGAGEKLRFIYSSTLGPVGGNAYFASTANFTSKADALTRFSRAIAKSMVFILANPKAAANIYLHVNPDAGSPSNPADIDKSAEEIAFWANDWKLNPGEKWGQMDLANISIYAKGLQAQGLLTTVPPVGEIFSNALIPGINDFDTAKVTAQALAWKV